MFNHIMVGSNDIERSRRFYDAVLGVLGAGGALQNRAGTGHMRLFYRHNGGTFCVSQPINGEPATHANGGTVGFQAPSRAAVQAFHAAGLANGGKDEGAPGPRSFTPTAYAAYLRDPDGNKICAYCFAPG